MRAAQIMGLDMAGVDMLESNDGPQVMEINSSPGLEGIEGASKVDVAGQIIEQIQQQVLFPEVDLNQRLALSAGYGIADLLIHNVPEIENKALRDTNLTERNIQVISITRHRIVIPNPKGDVVILPGDKLLCYGELRELRGLIKLPPKKRKKQG